MNRIAVVAAIATICAVSQTATAQTGDCKGIADATARLACYDKTGPRAAPKLPAPKTTDGKYVDTIGAEDARMNARLKNICRGC